MDGRLRRDGRPVDRRRASKRLSHKSEIVIVARHPRPTTTTSQRQRPRAFPSAFPRTPRTLCPPCTRPPPPLPGLDPPAQLSDSTHSLRHVVDRLQERRQPRDDPGPHEDGPGRAHQRPRFRDGAPPLPHHGNRRHQAPERSKGLPRLAARHDGLADAHRRDHRRLLRRRGHQGRRVALVQAGRDGPGRRDHQGARRPVPHHGPRPHPALLLLLPGHQLVHHQTRAQANGLRPHARPGQEADGQARQGRDQAAPRREGRAARQAGLRPAQRDPHHRVAPAHRPPRPLPRPQLRGPGQDPAPLLRRGLFAHGPGAAVSRRKHQGSVRPGRAGRPRRGGAAGDSRPEHCWHRLRFAPLCDMVGSVP